MYNFKTFKISPCKWEEIHPHVENHIRTGNITVDSYWEDHVLESKTNYYKITCDEKLAGYFAVNNEQMLILFNVFAPFADKSQELFHQVKKYEQITNAMVTTGDELFLSHCMDNFKHIEKQAYFSIYTEKEIPQERCKPLVLRLADIEKDFETLKLCGDFLDDSIDKIPKGGDYIKLYIAELEDDTENILQTVGFGVIEYGRVLTDIASIGMFVCEQYRKQGIAANILQGLKHIAIKQNCRVFSGCWYYNHNSKKSMESAGAYSKSRLLRFYF